jgi:hypothetical protein
MGSYERLYVALHGVLQRCRHHHPAAPWKGDHLRYSHNTSPSRNAVVPDSFALERFYFYRKVPRRSSSGCCLTPLHRRLLLHRGHGKPVQVACRWADAAQSAEYPLRVPVFNG